MSDENSAAEDGSQAAPADTTISFNKVVDDRGIPIGNVLKEITRKLSRVNEKLDMNFASAAASPDKGKLNALGNGIDPQVKAYIDASREEVKQAEVAKAQQAALDLTFKEFPELNPDSDSFDREFYNLAVEIEQNFDSKSPNRTYDAAQLAALKLGKVEKLTKTKVIQDDRRRSRILEEGSVSTKEARSTKSGTDKMNKSFFKNVLKIDPSKAEKMIREIEE